MPLQARQAEVCYLQDAIIAKENVLRLQVAVKNLPGVAFKPALCLKSFEKTIYEQVTLEGTKKEKNSQTVPMHNPETGHLGCSRRSLSLAQMATIGTSASTLRAPCEGPSEEARRS